MNEFGNHLRRLVASGRDCVVCGDWNVAHKEIDLRNHKANRKRPGFLPKERAWLDQVFGSIGLTDAFRLLHTESGHYTWWSNRTPTARARNVGWRLDYQAVTPGLGARVRSASIAADTRFSDHAPLIVDYQVASGSPLLGH
jgi:exodeoxyribonuclease-3